MREIELELKQGKDPHFKHVYVFQHPTPKRRGLLWLVFILLLGGGAAALYFVKPTLVTDIYDQSRQYLNDGYARIIQTETPENSANTPASATSPSGEDNQPPASHGDATLSKVPADTAAEEVKLAQAEPDSASTQPPPLPEPPPDTAPLPELAPVAEPALPSAPQQAPVIDLPDDIADSAALPDATDTAQATTSDADTNGNADNAQTPELDAEDRQLLDQGMAYVSDNQLYQPQNNNAAEVYQALRDASPEAAKRLLEAIMLAAYQRAQASSEQGDLATTKQLFEQTQKLAPQHEIVAELRRIVAESLATQALDQIARNQLFDKEDSAYITYRQLLKLSPNPATGETIRERLLAALKERAEEQIKRKRYTTPKDNNAFDSYRLMLRIMPKNAAAQAGLKVLADKYAWLTKRELDRGRNKRALEFVKRGLDIQPRDKTLLAYQETILGYQEKPFESMLQRAKQHISAGRLMFPPGNNAYDIYQQVLQNDPEQAEAHQGLQEIADIYAQKAKVARAKGQLTESRTHIEAGLQVLPGHQELLKIRQELDSLSE